MDPLSMTASIGAVLHITAALMTYLSDVKSVGPDQEQIVIEACNLHGLLINFRNRVEKSRVADEWFDRVRALGIKNGPLDQFEHILKGLLDKVSTTGKRARLKSALMWKWTKVDVDIALHQLERLKSLVQLTLSSDNFDLSQAIHQDVMDLKNSTKQIELGVEQLKVQADREVLAKLSLWLKLPDPSPNYHAALKKRHPGTGVWLLNDPKYEVWKNSQSSLLWLYGNAGCGKTVLSATVLQDVTEYASKHQRTLNCYFYFDFNDDQKQDSSLAMRSLLLQLAPHIPEGLEKLQKLHETSNFGQRQPSDDQIRSILSFILNQAPKTYMVLDALDECRTSDREDIIYFIESLMSQGLNIHILLTSRHERDIEVLLDPLAESICIESAVMDADIEAYVRGRLKVDMKLKRLPPVVQDEIVHDIMSKADGMFRWVYCQIEALRNCRDLPALRKALAQLPKTLDETYTRIFRIIGENDNLEQAITTLQWLCFSDKPLTLAELVDVLAIECAEDCHGSFDPVRRMFNSDGILEICSGFIAYTAEVGQNDTHNRHFEAPLEDPNSWSVDHDTYMEENYSYRTIRVQLAHFSVKEYLLSDRCAFRSHFVPDQCHEKISQSCINYLRFLHGEALSNSAKDINHCYPLTDYAGGYWHSHARRSNDKRMTATSKALTDLICTFLIEEQRLHIWSRLHDVKSDKLDEFKWGLDDLNSPVCRAASKGLISVIQPLTEKGYDLEASGIQAATPLYCAVVSGHREAVRVLLDVGSEVNVQGDKRLGRMTVLQAALMHGDHEIVQMLFDAGADIKLQYGAAYHPIMAKSLYHDEKIVRILLNQGADVNILDKYRNTPLAIASLRGDKNLVQNLLDCGADVHKQAYAAGLALNAAAEKGHLDIMQVLLNAGADPNRRSEFDDCDALHAGLRSSIKRNEVVQLLLAKGAHVWARSGRYSNALEAAMLFNHQQKEVVQMLLTAGAPVNADGHVYGSALEAALTKSYNPKEVVSMLLNAGADVNLRGGKHANILQAAAGARNNRRELVQMLLAAGADVNLQRGFYGNVLQTASRLLESDEKLVRTLLDAGADVNMVGGFDGTALQAALLGFVSLDEDEETIVQMLVDFDIESDVQSSVDLSGVVVGAPVSVDSSILSRLKSKKKEIIRILLDAGADVNIKGGPYKTALHTAVNYCDVEVVKQLLDAGADVNVSVETLGTAFQTAALRQPEAGCGLGAEWATLMQILLDAGADMNCTSGTKGSALSIAAMYGYEERVRILLDAGADVNAQSPTVGSALQAAVSAPMLSPKKSMIRIVQMLLDAGANVNTRGGDYGCALNAAMENDLWDIEQMLLDAGADPSLLTTGETNVSNDEDASDEHSDEEDGEKTPRRSHTPRSGWTRSLEGLKSL